ncbi:hypothetical protein B566_EDAN017133 [Ephemera danica]|nr:hypothetical protein B566_EDAN017133 [Ephemera danica]
MSPCITPLHLTNCQGTPDDVKQLDEVIKIDPQALHRPQHSISFEFALPVMCAAEAGHAGCLELLLDRGADVNCLGREGRRPMFYAVRAGSAECVELLASRGSPVDHITKDGSRTTLYLEQACQAGYGDIVRILLQRGAMSGMTMAEEESTPLNLAVAEGHPSCVKWLLLYGADRAEARLRNDVLKLISNPQSCKGTPEAREEMLTIMHELGINIRSWVLPLRKRGADRLAAHVQTLLRNPRTLQSACRVTVRRALGHRHYTQQLRELRVPPYFRSILDSRLNSYLHYQ